ncbi:hypothetical protein V6N13_030567 [Hibiscus sabdariffa]
MIEGKAQWNERKVKQVFMERDAQIILQCPIASTREDVLRWSHHSSGLYVTKTAHHWLEKQGNHNEGSSELWKTLARMDVLPKIQIFGWRLGYEALPVGTFSHWETMVGRGNDYTGCQAVSISHYSTLECLEQKESLGSSEPASTNKNGG